MIFTFYFYFIQHLPTNLIFMFPDSYKLQMDLERNKREKLEMEIRNLRGEGYYKQNSFAFALVLYCYYPAKRLA